MTAMEYLNSILRKYDTTLPLLLPFTPAYQAIVPVLRTWANNLLLDVKVSGSNAKGTAVAGVADLDLFVSLHPNTINIHTLAEIYNSLATTMRGLGYAVQRQNVSIGINYGGIKVDIVPGVKFSGNTSDHWLYVTKSGRDRTKTNIDFHINRISRSGRVDEIRLTKIWRLNNNLDFPSTFLEEAVLDALSGYSIGNTDVNFWRVLEYLQTDIVTTYIVDPANSANVISNDLTQAEKNIISNAAAESRKQQYWGSVVY